eukprot:863415-Karenia_brevis.AAC.1
MKLKASHETSLSLTVNLAQQIFAALAIRKPCVESSAPGMVEIARKSGLAQRPSTRCCITVIQELQILAPTPGPGLRKARADFLPDS